jgi:SOS-response transcriptional repressor LexA
MESRHDRLRKARIAAGYERQRDVLARYPSWNRNSYKSNENGNAGFSWEQAKVYAKAFGVRPEWLFDGAGPMKDTRDAPTVRILGKVGADPSGRVAFALAHESWDTVPRFPGLSEDAGALEVEGHSMPDFAPHGSLIFFDGQRTDVTAELLGAIVVAETAAGEVLLKRLRRGSKRGLYDLESIHGPTVADAKLNWVAEVRIVVQPHLAQQLITRGEAAAA